MAGTIVREDIEAVRERTRIDDIVGERVALKPAGVGSLKGLCPFHDEKTPSFHVRPAVGRWHCFGCSEGGDVISFLMKADGMSFVEAVEYLAGRLGITLRYESGGRRTEEAAGGGRKRVLEANRVAAEFFAKQLGSADAAPGRDFLKSRGFDKGAAEHFGVGYAPAGWHALVEHLRRSGFTEAEIEASGLASRGQKGLYDRFRGRLVWPIRSVSGEPIGFGARKLATDDDGPKYLNTPETVVYKKSQVLYGLDLAKRDIASTRRVVVVEGYTDVMACHLAGVTTAVATCGTAFGEDHARLLRRLLGDEAGGGRVGLGTGEVVFTFDADDAGRAAALKAFALEAEFLSQTFVAIGPDGLDPCDLRLERGDAAVADLVESRVPLFEYVIRAALAGNDLETAEGRVAALRAAAPIVARIKDTALRPEYARRLAGWLGIDIERVRQAVVAAGKATRAPRRSDGPPDDAPPPVAVDPKDPVVRSERMALEVLLQAPTSVPTDLAARLDDATFTVPQYRAVWEGIVAAGGFKAAAAEPGAWPTKVEEAVAGAVAPVVSELAVSPLQQDRESDSGRYARGVVANILDLAMTRRIAETRGRMQRIGEGNEGYSEAFAALVALEKERQEIRGE